MTSAIEQLKILVPPPNSPHYAGPEQGFLLIEEKLGIALPLDYKLLISAYGTGSWLEFYWVMNPFDPRMAAEWFDDRHWRLQSCRNEREQSPRWMPYPIWPDSGGLLPWGGSENGGTLFWLTEGNADTWPTIHMADRTPEYDRLNESCASVLLSAVSRSNPIVAEIPWSLKPNAKLFTLW